MEKKLSLDCSTVLFVGDLSSVCTEFHIRDLLQQNGFDDVEIKMMGGRASTTSFDYAFVKFNSHEMASAALRMLDGTMLCGRKLRIRWGDSSIKSAKSKIVNSLHVRFQSLQPDVITNEEIITNVFKPFGTILDVSIKSFRFDEITGLQSGYGFVHFPCTAEGIASSYNAVLAMTQNPVIDNVHYSCEQSKNMLKLLQASDRMHAAAASPFLASVLGGGGGGGGGMGGHSSHMGHPGYGGGNSYGSGMGMMGDHHMASQYSRPAPNRSMYAGPSSAQSQYGGAAYGAGGAYGGRGGGPSMYPGMGSSERGGGGYIESRGGPTYGLAAGRGSGAYNGPGGGYANGGLYSNDFKEEAMYGGGGSRMGGMSRSMGPGVGVYGDRLQVSNVQQGHFGNSGSSSPHLGSIMSMGSSAGLQRNSYSTGSDIYSTQQREGGSALLAESDLVVGSKVIGGQGFSLSSQRRGDFGSDSLGLVEPGFEGLDYDPSVDPTSSWDLPPPRLSERYSGGQASSGTFVGSNGSQYSRGSSFEGVSAPQQFASQTTQQYPSSRLYQEQQAQDKSSYSPHHLWSGDESQQYLSSGLSQSPAQFPFRAKEFQHPSGLKPSERSNSIPYARPKLPAAFSSSNQSAGNSGVASSVSGLSSTSSSSLSSMSSTSFSPPVPPLESHSPTSLSSSTTNVASSLGSFGNVSAGLSGGITSNSYSSSPTSSSSSSFIIGSFSSN